MKKLSSPVIKDLKYYVYIYSHPETGDIFYVGKGKGNRIFSHLEDQKESQKVKYLTDLKQHGLAPKLEVLIHGLEDEKMALRVESSIIDLLGIQHLTNKQSGYKSGSFGRMSLKQVKALYDKQPVHVDDPALLIRINKAFRYSMTPMELYDYTRCQWRLNPNRAKKATYALAIFEGIVQEVYTIYHWYEAGLTFNLRQNEAHTEHKSLAAYENRYEFIGNLASEDIRNKYRFKSVGHYFKQGNSNPIMYKNV
jgi:hypothetical protein